MVERARTMTLEPKTPPSRLDPAIRRRMFEPLRDRNELPGPAKEPSDYECYQTKGFHDRGLAGVVGAYDDCETT